MHPLRLLAGCLITLSVAAAARAEPPHPLRLVPPEANLVIRIEQPRKLVETLTQLPAVQALRHLPFAREQLESPAIQRFLHLVAYYEQDLGMPWPELLDNLAAHGITLATKAGE